MKRIKSTQLARIVLAVLILFTASAGMAAKKSGAQELPSLKGKKILMVWGGWDGHYPKELTEKVLPFLKEEGAIVTVLGKPTSRMVRVIVVLAVA